MRDLESRAPWSRSALTRLFGSKTLLTTCTTPFAVVMSALVKIALPSRAESESASLPILVESPNA